MVSSSIPCGSEGLWVDRSAVIIQSKNLMVTSHDRSTYY